MVLEKSHSLCDSQRMNLADLKSEGAKKKDESKDSGAAVVISWVQLAFEQDSGAGQALRALLCPE